MLAQSTYLYTVAWRVGGSRRGGARAVTPPHRVNADDAAASYGGVQRVGRRRWRRRQTNELVASTGNVETSARRR